MDDQAVRLRPNVLAYPAATTGRFVLLVAAMLNAGLLSGLVVHSLVNGARWAQAAQACWASAQTDAMGAGAGRYSEALRASVTSCLGPAQRTQVGYMVVGAVLIAALGLAILVLIPPVLRRRYGLRPAGPRMDGAVARIAELAAQAGLRRPPRLLVGGAGQRDAFVFGLPGRYLIVLPLGLLVRWRDEALFDPVVRHELAHLRRRDVPLAWLATAVWIAAVPVLALPLILSAVRWDFSVLPQYLWRVALVMGVIWLLRRQALRSREHDADLEAARRAGDHRPLSAVLRTATGAQPGGWRRLLSYHPTVAHRLEVLDLPGRVPGVSIVDSVAAGFLTGLLLPLVFQTINTALAGGPGQAWAASYLAALIVGPITGFTVGVGLWRQALIDRVTGEKTWPGGVVTGLAGGLLLGHWTSFGLGGLVAERDVGDEFAVAVTIVIGAAAALLSAGTGRLCADAAARLPGGPRSWWWALAVNGLVFTVAAWALTWLPMNLYAVHLVTAGPVGALDAADLAIQSGYLVGPLVFVMLVPFIAAMVAMVWRRVPRPIPPWLLDGPQQAGAEPGQPGGPRLRSVLTGALAAGAVAVIGVAVHRATNPAPADDEQRLRIYLVWLIAGTLAALLGSLIALVSAPRTGAAIGLIAGITAGLVAVAGMVAVNVAGFGDPFDPRFHFEHAVSTLSLWTLGYLWLLPLSLAVWPRRS